MTQSGINNTYLEKNNSSELSEMHVFDIQMHYLLLHQQGTVKTQAPYKGYLNVLLLRNKDNCICPYFINQQSYIIRGGENIIHQIDKGDIFEWKNIYDQNIGIVIFFPEGYLRELNFTQHFNSRRFREAVLTNSDSRMQLLQNQLLEFSESNSLEHKLRIQSCLIEIIAHQVESLQMENREDGVALMKSMYEKIMLAKKLIDEDMSRHYTISELAKLVGTNDQYLKKYFKQYVGKTVSNYITERKMHYAKQLIVSGNYRVVEVAHMIGYKHATHFTTAFKKYFGFIPNSLRYSFLLGYGGIEALDLLKMVVL